MKIVAFCNEFPPYRGGIATYASEMASAATALGARVTMIVPDYGKDRAALDTEFPFEILRYPGAQHAARDMPNKVGLVRDVLSARRPDLVHAMDWPFFIPIALHARKLPRLLTLHGSEIPAMAKPARRLVLAGTRALAGDVRIIGNSAFTEELFRRHFPAVPAAQINHQLLGVGQGWLSHASPPDVRKRLGLPEDKLIILTLARLTRRKGHLAVLEALRRLPPVLQARLLYVMAGSGSEADYLADLNAAVAGHPVAIRRLEGLDDPAVKDLCAASDMFCLPGASVGNNLVEGFGLALLEAGAMGLAPIAGRIGGMSEVIEHGKSGLIVPANDTPSLAAAIERLAGDPVLRRQLGRGARQRAEHLTWQRCAKATYGL